MGRSFSKPVCIVVNKATSAQYEWMLTALPEPEAVIGRVAMDDGVFLSGLKGEPVTQQVDGIDAVLARVAEAVSASRA